MTVQSVGKSMPRTGAVERLIGAWKFTGDLKLPDMLHVKLVQIDCGHARILGIDTSEAEAVPGVHCVLTAADLGDPVPRFGPISPDRPVLAAGRVNFHGEPVAAVAAVDIDTAAYAASLVKVRYEELPGVYTLDQALEPGAPLVQEPALRAAGPWRESNLLGEWDFAWGDSDAAARASALVVDETYSFPMVSHFAIEPHVFMAAPEGDSITVWSAVQHPFGLRKVLASLLGMPMAKVRVIVPDIGGGFGGKGYVKLEPLVAIMARRTGRPVKLTFDLHDSFLAARRAGSRIRLRTGFDSEGKILFHEAWADYLAGAYADVAARVVSKATLLSCGAYHAPNARYTGRAVLSHTVPSTAFRGFGAPQMVWAVESQMEEAARRLGIDAVELRLRNLPPKGGTLIPGDKPVDGDWAQGLRKAAAEIGWGRPLPPGRGLGIAIGIKSPAPATVSQAMLRLHQDGSATVYCGTTDMGQGARTVMRQIAAQGLGIPVDQVGVFLSDTGIVPFDYLTASSRSTVCMGNAILAACNDVLQQLRQMAAESHGCPPDVVQAAAGMVTLPGHQLSYADVVSEYYGVGQGEIMGQGTWQSPRDPKHPLGGPAPYWEVIFNAVAVEVDLETGHVTIPDLVSVGDVGKAINPAQVIGQDEGGAVMGLGHTLMEHLLYDSRGRMLNSSALDYRIPTIKDIPHGMRSFLIENQDGPGPFGSKGTGESGVLAVAPAVASAVARATGVTFRELPITPEAVWMGLKERQPAST